MKAIILALIQSFYAEAAARGIDLPKQDIEVVVRPFENNGRATKTATGWEITIDEEFAADPSRLVFHELGHALLGLDEGKGIMNAELVYQKVRKRDLDELFHMK